MSQPTNAPAIQIVSINQASGITLRISGAYYTRNQMMSVIMKAAYQLMAAFKHTRWTLTLGEAMSKAFAALRQAKKAVAKEAARMAARVAEQTAAAEVEAKGGVFAGITLTNIMNGTPTNAAEREALAGMAAYGRRRSSRNW